MKKVFWVGAGGAAGAVCRHFVQMIPLPGGELYRSLLTLLINISGSFLLGFLIILFVKCLPVSAEVRLGLTTGFLGGYTTFSTLCKDAVLLSLSGRALFSLLYLTASVLFGLAAAWLGILAAKRLERRMTA